MEENEKAPKILIRFEAGSNNTIIKDCTFNGDVYTSELRKKEAPQPTGGKDCDLVIQLMPICKDNEEYAKAFLEAVTDKSALEITDAVKSFREKKMIDAQLCHHKLWKLLSDNNIYKLGERNWNDRIKY